MIKRLAYKYITWNWGWNLDSAFRYDSAIRIIKEKKPKTVVEAGSGSRGISAYAHWPSYGVDLQFNESVPAGLQTRIKASATSLPFDDESADLVVSTDMIEHIKQEDRKAAIQEMFRIAKASGTVYITFPSGQMSAAADKEIFDAYLKKKGLPHTIFQEHLEIGPVDTDSLVTLVQEEAEKKGWSVTVSESTPLSLWIRYHYIFTVESFIPHLRHFQRLLSKPLFHIYKNAPANPGYRLLVIASKHAGAD